MKKFFTDFLHNLRNKSPEVSRKNHSKMIKRFIDKLGIEKVHLVGHDLGEGISQILMVNYPELFYDVTLINAVGFDYWPVQPISAMRTPIVRQLAMYSLDAGHFIQFDVPDKITGLLSKFFNREVNG